MICADFIFFEWQISDFEIYNFYPLGVWMEEDFTVSHNKGEQIKGDLKEGKDTQQVIGCTWYADIRSLSSQNICAPFESQLVVLG